MRLSHRCFVTHSKYIQNVNCVLVASVWSFFDDLSLNVPFKNKFICSLQSQFRISFIDVFYSIQYILFFIWKMIAIDTWNGLTIIFTLNLLLTHHKVVMGLYVWWWSALLMHAATCDKSFHWPLYNILRRESIKYHLHCHAQRDVFSLCFESFNQYRNKWLINTCFTRHIILAHRCYDKQIVFGGL